MTDSSQLLSSVSPYDWGPYQSALETYGKEYFSRLPELLTPSRWPETGLKRIAFLLTSTRRNLPRLDGRTVLRLQQVLETR